MSEKQVTVLEEIVGEVTNDLFYYLKKDMPEDMQKPEDLKQLAQDASDITLFVVQNFMNKFNAAAEELKNA